MKVILFDYNGLLVDDLPIHLKAWCELAKRINSKETKGTISKLVGMTSTLRIAEFISDTKDPEVAGPLVKEKGEIYLDLVKAKDIVFPETRQVIPFLVQQYTLGIVTNLAREQFVNGFPEDLQKHFSLIITYEEIPKPKPAPDSLVLAAERLGVSVEEACYVGDAPVDMQASRAAGMLAVGVPTGNHSEEQLKEAGADVVLPSLAELEKELESR